MRGSWRFWLLSPHGFPGTFPWRPIIIAATLGGASQSRPTVFVQFNGRCVSARWRCGIRGRLGAGGGNGAIGLSRLTPQLPCRHPFASPPATQSRLVLARFYCFWQLLIFFQLILLVDTLGPTWSSIHFLNGPGSLAIGGIATIFRKWQKNIIEEAEKKISGGASHPPCNRLNRPHPTIQSVRPTSHVQSNLLHQIVDITMKSSSRSSQPTSVLKKET